MKKLILTILTTITILGINAQGNNLQFNQVLNYEYSVYALNYETSYSAGTIIVPQNKVWKITYSSVYSSTEPNNSEAVSAFVAVPSKLPITLVTVSVSVNGTYVKPLSVFTWASPVFD